MINTNAETIRDTVAEGTGAAISLEIDTSGLQKAVVLWFSDLGKRNGPCIHFGPAGLRRHNVKLSFGNFSGQIIEQIANADLEAVQLSRALVKSVSDDVTLYFSPGVTTDNWVIIKPDFTITAQRKSIDNHLSEKALEDTCHKIVVPVMAALAELIGYDEIMPEISDDEPAWEGAEKPSVIKRRERNPRNRLLCLRIHGYFCNLCDEDPRAVYGMAGSILEVHHLEPLSQLATEKLYDPQSDLIPLCPNCHRAVHTRRPVPWTPLEIQEMRQNAQN